MNQVIAYSIILLLIAAAGAGFYMGYEQGKEPDQQEVLLQQISEQAEELKQLKETVRSLELNQASRTYSVVPAGNPPAPSSEPVTPNALRAEKTTQIFTDRKGRELIATIIKVGPDSTQVKRDSDGRVFDLRHVDLIAKDREFLEYLYAQNSAQSQPKGKTNPNDIDWEAIFGK